MSKCADPSCNNQKGEKLIKCSSPFCERQFHLTCANLKGKTKAELNNIYFLCNACDDFIRYSNSRIENKLNSLEVDLKAIIKPIELKLLKIEDDLSKQMGEITERVKTIEDKQLKQNSIVDDLITKIDCLEKRLENEVKCKISPTPPVTNDAATSYNVNNTDCMVKYRVRLSGLPEPSNDLKFMDRQKEEQASILNIMKFINMENVPISDCFRIGKYKEENKLPRRTLITFSSVWDRRKVVSNAYLLKNYNLQVYISPELTVADKAVEKTLMQKRWELIQSGTDKKLLKIKNLKLYKNGEEVVSD